MNRKATLSPLLPDDLIEEILLRLPVRSLLRFRYVCKSWLSLISSFGFTKSHFDLAAASTHRLLLQISEVDSEVTSVDIEAPLDGDPTEQVFNISLLSPVPNNECWIDMVGSCRGFILLNELDFGYFVIWNPSTGLYKRVNNAITDAHLFGFGYDSSTDDYVLVTVTLPRQSSGRLCSEVYCFSLRTNSWSCTEGSVPYRCLAPEFSPGSFLNGALHWLVESYDNSRVIISFDVMERRLSEIPLPHDLVVGLKFKIHHFTVMGGCLCLSVTERDIRGNAVPEMWMMKEYKVQSSWTKSFILSDYCPLFSSFFPACFTKNGEILGSNGKKTLVRLNDKGTWLAHRTHCSDMPVSMLHSIMYRESLLSLPGESEETTKDEQCEV